MYIDTETQMESKSGIKIVWREMDEGLLSF